MPASAARRGPSGPERDERPRVATPTDVSAAIAERRRREARRRRMLTLGVAGVLLLALVLLWLVRFSGVLAARTVQVNGTSRLSAEQVAQVAQVPIGTPLVMVDEKAVANRVASQLAPVGQVRVHTRLPHTVVVDVTERTPVYQRVAGNQYQLVDADGVVFAVMANPVKGLPKATTQGVDNRLLAGVSTVVRSLPTAVGSHLVDIRATSLDGITLQLDKGRTVVWGSADSSAQKAAVLTVLLTKQANTYDVSSPSTPTTR